MTAMGKTEDRWIKCLSTSGTVRGVALNATHLVQDMVDRQELSEVGAIGLGQATVGALLLASQCNTGQRVNLNVRGSGAYQQALVDAYPEGHVRGYVTERTQESSQGTMTLQFDGQLLKPEVGPWGTGLLSVLKTRDDQTSSGQRAPYIGTVPLVTGHLAKDLSFYCVQSEQIPSAVGISVVIKKNAKAKNKVQVVSAIGFLVQAMPGAGTEEIQELEKHIHELESFSKVANEKLLTPTYLLSQIFQSLPFMIMDDRPILFSCNCSVERVHRAMSLIGVDELTSMLKEDRAASVRCDFCATEYQLGPEVLEEMIQSALAAQDSTPD
jgi:molecular chaperone Hsp33